MQILFFVLYACIFIYFFKFIFKTKTASISFKHAVCFFLLKTAVGCVYGLLFFNFYNSFNNDTWHFINAALFEYNILIKEPSMFLNGLFKENTSYKSYTALFDSSNNFWKDLPNNILIKLLIIFNFFTKGNYFLNTLFFNFFVFWGHYYFYKLLILFYPNKKAVSFFVTFLFPPLLFWVSGISKDGFVFVGIAGFFYHFFFFLNTKKASSFIKTFFFFIAIFLMRNFIAVSIIPVIIACILSYKKKNNAIVYTYLIVISLFFFFFAATGFLTNKMNLPLKMAERQAAFQHLEGGSYMYLPQLKPTFSSYLEVFPYALNHTFLRPYIFESKSVFLFFASLESWFVILIITFTFFKIKKLKTIAEHPLLMLLLFLALINYLMIGYTVPFAGAIVRYRVFFEVMLLLPMFIVCDGNNKLEIWLNKWLRLY